MTNHLTSDGLLAVDECTRPIRYRDETLILQDTCTPEPRTELIIRRHGGYESTVETLTVERATALYQALGTFLASSRGQTGWQYDGVIYDLDKAWQGRPGTGLDQHYWRHTGDFRDGVPLMRAIDDAHPTAYVVTLADVLGLQPCTMHGIYSAPCHLCVLDNVREHLRGNETADVDGVAYGEGFEPRGDQR